MTWVAPLLLLFGTLTGLLLLGLPVALGFLAVDVAGALAYLGGAAGLKQLARNAIVSVTSFSLTPIPFFILMGEVLFHTGVAYRAIGAIEQAIRRVPGRLAVVAVAGGTVFSAISGSTIATTAMLGSLLLPTMLKRGYHPTMALGPIMAIGSVDMLIPPSALTVLLGSLGGISISRLLVAGVVPGLVMSAMLVGYIVIRAWLRPHEAPMDDSAGDARGWARWRPLMIDVVPLVAIFALVVGAMAAGWATPTEAAALGALATMVAAAAYRALSIAALRTALRGTAAISGMILFIIMAATTFSQILSFSGATNGLVAAVTDLGLGPHALLLAMLAILLLLGCFVDQVSMMLITLPFYMPLVQQLAIDPVWFGVLFLICMQLGLLTPPFGLLLFTVKGVAPPGIGMRQVTVAVLPFVGLAALLLLLVYLFPALATWLPKALGS